MMDINEIKRMNKDAEDKARQTKTLPLIAKKNKDTNMRNIPFIGDYTPKGWTKTDNLYFVDSSGFGVEGEPALTFEQFIDKIKKGFGYAIVECGQFQVYIQEFKKI